jgi:glycosyltransferase involved in cell wall biosynthesis
MDRQDVRLALIFKDFAAWIRTSCVGLNVAGYTTAKVLRDQGIDVSVFPVRHNIDIVNALDKYNETHEKPLTHVVISAPWLTRHELKCIIRHYPTIQFVILSHSNVGFLQADPGGVELLRSYLSLAEDHENLKVGGNSARFVEWLRRAYRREADQTVLLPNLYPLDPKLTMKAPWDSYSPIKIGAFGAVRPEKNFMTAAAAAILIHSILNVPVEFHMSEGGEGDQGRTSPAIEQMVAGIPGITLVRHEWMFWDRFIELISEMDLLIQVSYTESFNMVTADGISVGVPSVVSPVIYWAPNAWKADPDDVVEVAEIGLSLLTNSFIRSQGIDALRKHNKRSLKDWLRFLDVYKPSYLDSIRSWLF